MRRRAFIAGLGALVTWPRAARAQQATKTYRIAFAAAATPLAWIETDDPGYRALTEELRRLGYAEGRNLVVERRSAEGKPELYASIAREVVKLAPDVVVVPSTKFALSFKQATGTIPVVAQSFDPVGSGLVTSLTRPGGNVTGIASGASVEIIGKYFEILKEIDPKISRVGFLTDAPTPSMWEALQSTVRQLAATRYGMIFVGKPLASPMQEPEYRLVIDGMVQEGAQALIVDMTPTNYANAPLIARLANANRLPAISAYVEHAKNGGLASYAPDLDDAFRQMAGYVDRILKGEKPGDLPFAQPTIFKFIINLKTAKSLGLEIPLPLLARADEVIE